MQPLDLLTRPARQAAVLEHVDHRPWPLPTKSWVLAQTWDDLLFAHWRVPIETIRALVPPQVEVDEHDGSAWLGVTPFLLSGFRFRGTLPVPWISTFPELNVRTYVTFEEKRGIWFFSLDTSNPLAVEGARRAYRLPYFHARMSVEHRGETIAYSSARRDGQARPFVFNGSYRPVRGVTPPAPGSLEYFLTERYCLYTLDEGRLWRADIHHLPWPLQVADAEIELNTMAPDSLELNGEEPLFHFSRNQDVVIWPLEEAET